MKPQPATRRPSPQSRIAQNLAAAIRDNLHNPCHHILATACLEAAVIAVARKQKFIVTAFDNAVQRMSPTIAEQHHIATPQLTGIAPPKHNLGSTTPHQRTHTVTENNQKNIVALGQKMLNLSKKYLIRNYYHPKKLSLFKNALIRHYRRRRIGQTRQMPHRHTRNQRPDNIANLILKFVIISKRRRTRRIYRPESPQHI